MAEQHTPGPWAADEERQWDIVIRNSQRDPVALGYTSGWDKPTARANARLIAASPTMYSYIQERANEGDKKAQEIIKSLD